MRKPNFAFATLVLLGLSLTFPTGGSPAQTGTQPRGLGDILSYISSSWNTLTRTLSECKTFTDAKGREDTVLYLPADFPTTSEIQNLEKSCSLPVRRLPAVIKNLGQIDADSISPQGLLYLPNPYVVPGGMFNEMYGWDSYFIIRGLIEDGKVDLAKGIVRNFFFEIAHYGAILNANRTYDLTRSQPPFLTSMILAVYDVEKSHGQTDRAWLEEAYPFALKDYQLWTHAPHLAGDTGLSRYYDFGDGPAAELGADINDYYGGVVRYFLLHPEADKPYLEPAGQPNVAGPVYTIQLCPPNSGARDPAACETVENVALTKRFYRDDRSMRESGFDIAFRFGPFGAGTTDYADLGLNTLLYKAETDLERISRLLSRPAASAEWHSRALDRRKNINRYFWNAQRGLFFDYDFKTKKQSSYEYATTFYPLWAGLATPEQARAVQRNLKLFDQPGGIVMSTHKTNAQWDYPYGWAPVQLIAVEGLRRYGFNADADHISTEFLSMVLENFRRDGTIREKYNVVTRSSETSVSVGYSTNMVGFGWTNGVFLVLLHELPKDLAAHIE